MTNSGAPQRMVAPISALGCRESEMGRGIPLPTPAPAKRRGIGTVLLPALAFTWIWVVSGAALAAGTTRRARAIPRAPRPAQHSAEGAWEGGINH